MLLLGYLPYVIQDAETLYGQSAYILYICRDQLNVLYGKSAYIDILLEMPI